MATRTITRFVPTAARRPVFLRRAERAKRRVVVIRHRRHRRHDAH